MNGIDSNRLGYTASTTSPVENAEILSSKLDTKDVFLIASDIDAQKIMLAFQSQDFTPCLLIPNMHNISAHPLRMWLPSAESVTTSEKVLWEVTGMLWYWVKDDI